MVTANLINHSAKPGSYSGLTVILGKPSRFDGKKLPGSTQLSLISGYAGTVFDTYIHPLGRHQVDIRTSDYNISNRLRDGTKVVLLLGEESLKFYPGFDPKKTTLNDARGNPLKCQLTGVVYIPSYAPQDSMDMRDYESDDGDESEGDNEDDNSVKSHGTTKRRNWKWWLFADIKKAKRILEVGGIIEDIYAKYNIHINPDVEYVSEELKKFKDNDLFLDIETSQRQVMTCCGLGLGKDIYVVPWKKWDNTLAMDRVIARRFIQALAVAIGSNTVVCHNALFDLLVLCWRYKIPLPKSVFDTMLGWHRAYPEIEKSLGHLISYFLNLPYHKDEGIYNPRNPLQEQQLYNYNAKDIVTMAEIKPRLVGELNKLGAFDSAIRANRMVRPYLTATMRGIKLDTDKFCRRFDQLDLKKTQIDRCLRVITKTPEFNPRSWQQVEKYLYANDGSGLGLHCPDEDQPTNSKTLLRVLTKNEVPSIKLILLTKRTGKLASSMKFRLWKDSFNDVYNRATTGYIIAGTDTFRLGSRAIFKYKRGATEDEKLGYGTNLQNQKKEQRSLFIPDTGKKFGQVDQAGAEALVVAYLCRAGKFRSLFLNGIKSHVFVGLHVFKDAWKKRIKKPEIIDEMCLLSPSQLKAHASFKEVKDLIASSDEWPARERYYFIAKMICHAANYGMKAPTFQINVLEKSDGAVVLSKPQCEGFLSLYHGLFPEIHEWHNDIKKELQQTRILRNLFGEPRRFNGHFDDSLWKAGYAFKPQSTVGQITNIAFTELQEGLDNGTIDSDKSIGLEILQNNHDSILFQFNDGDDRAQLEACKIVSSKMQPELVSPRGEKFFMKTECQVGYNWCPRKKIVNERGLEGVVI